MKLGSVLAGPEVATLRRIWSTLRFSLEGQRRGLATAFLLSLGYGVIQLLRPWPIQIVFDHVLIPQDGVRPPFGLTGETVIAAAAVGVLLLSVAIGTLSARSLVASAKVGRKVATRIRRTLFEHLHRLHFPFHHSHRSGDLLVRLMGDVDMVRDVLFASWITLLERGIIFIGTAAIMAVLDPRLALVALLPLPLLALQVRRSSRELKEVTRKQRRRQGGAASFAAETLRNVRVVKAYAAEDDMTTAFARDARSAERAGVKAARISGRMAQRSELLTGLGLGLVLALGAGEVAAGHVTAGELLVFLAYTRAIYKPVRKVTTEGTRLGKAVACAERLVEILELPPEDERHDLPNAPRFRGDIAFEDVRYTYANGTQALKGCSLQVPAGAVAVLTGPNGSGKSTMLSLLLSLLHPDEGRVTIDGADIARFSLSSYRKQFAYVPQETLLFGATVKENIIYGKPDASDAAVEAAARAALLDEVIADLPDGIETVLGEGGMTLSGGQARRLMLARAAVRDASILLLDEPLTGLDLDARPIVAQAIRNIAAGRTAIVVSHDSLQELAPDLTIKLSNGRVEELSHTPQPARSSTPSYIARPFAVGS